MADRNIQYLRGGRLLRPSQGIGQIPAPIFVKCGTLVGRNRMSTFDDFMAGKLTN